MTVNWFINAERMRLIAWVVKRAVYTVPLQLMSYRRANHRRIVINQLLGCRHFSSKRKIWNDQSRIYLQALGVDIDKLDQTRRRGVSWSIEQIKPRIMILLQAGLDKNTISQIITHRPSILNMEENALKIRLTFLNSLGLNRSKLCKLLSEGSFLLTYQESEAQQLLTFLQSRDLNKFKAWQVILNCPRLFTTDIDCMYQIINLLRQKSLTELEINDIVIHHSSTLLLSYDQLKDLLQVLKSYLSSVAAVKDVILKHPSILQLTHVAVINVAQWLNQSLGLSDTSVGLLFHRYPQILEMSCESLAASIRHFQSLGIDLKLISQILFSKPVYFKYDYNIIANKFQTLFTLKFTEMQVKTILSFNPSVLEYREECVQQRCNYLIHVMGYSHQAIAENAAVLSCPLSKLKNRWSRWQNQPNYKELVSPVKLLLTSDDKFEKEILENNCKTECKHSPELSTTESQKAIL